MNELNYILVNAQILPEIYTKVIEAKRYLESGEAKNATQAAKLAGLSRSAYYKYKDYVFEYNPLSDKEIASLSLKLLDAKGVLSAVTNEIYLHGANVLSINQVVPENGIADVTITIRIAEMAISISELKEKLLLVNGVKSVTIKI